MGKKRYYCEYCDIYLTSLSASIRKQHNKGKNHKRNVQQYYGQFMKPNIINAILNPVIQEADIISMKPMFDGRNYKRNNYYHNRNQGNNYNHRYQNNHSGNNNNNSNNNPGYGPSRGSNNAYSSGHRYKPM